MVEKNNHTNIISFQMSFLTVFAALSTSFGLAKITGDTDNSGADVCTKIIINHIR